MSGSTGTPNTGTGVEIDNTSGNVIGGTGIRQGNVISDNQGGGIDIIGGTGNRIVGNNVGTDVTGTQALTNGIAAGPNQGYDILLSGGSGNTIGGTQAGAGNIIAGANGSGVVFDDSNDNTLQGNRIGTDISGEHALANSANGVSLVNGASGNLIGGTTAAARNIISGNSGDGVAITYTGDLTGTATLDTHNTVEGNCIGLDATGDNALANGTGVVIYGGANDNQIGGTSSGSGNVISGNSNGVVLDQGVSGNRIEGNKIGTNAQGLASAGGDGVEISGASGNFIGGTAAGAGNLIAGGQGLGLVIQAAVTNMGPTYTTTPASGNVVQGNMMGTDVTGMVNLGGGALDITGASNNLIGGTTAAARNYLVDGLSISSDFNGDGASGNVVEGNFIGTNRAGTVAIGAGIDLYGATNNQIGGTAAGAGNLISSVDVWNLRIDYGSSGNVVEGNKIGTDVTGTYAADPNGQPDFGVYITSANNNIIGGTAAGAGNLISGNGTGIDISSYSFTPGQVGVGNLIEGNKIGTDSTGTHAVGNGTGITLENYTSNNVVGGTATGAGNLISGNDKGLQLGGDGNSAEGNRIGTNAQGTAALANLFGGVILADGQNNILGGTSSGSGNLISGNGSFGVLVQTAPGDVIEGNRIGTNAAGTSAVANQGPGVEISGAYSVTIGGTASGAGNLISGNNGDGILFNNPVSPYLPQPQVITIQGNDIGTTANGKSKLGNSGDGIDLNPGSSAVIGGPRAGNVIAYNGGSGVDVQSGQYDLISQNSIFGNGVAGITLNSANNANNLLQAPVLSSASVANGLTTVQGTLSGLASNTTYTLEFFASSPGSSGPVEGQRYLGTVTVTTDDLGSAVFSVSFPVAVGSGQLITATTTDGSNDTSMFSNAVTA